MLTKADISTSQHLGAPVDLSIHRIAVLILQLDEVARRLPAMTRPLKSSTIRGIAGRICDLSEVLNLAVKLGLQEDKFEQDVAQLLGAFNHMELLLAKSRHSHELAFAIRLGKSIASRLEASRVAWYREREL